MPKLSGCLKLRLPCVVAYGLVAVCTLRADAQPTAAPPTNPALADPLNAVSERARDRLSQAKQLLAQGRTGTDTQAAQTEVLDALDRLIAAAQRQEAAERQAGGAGAAGRTQTPKPAASPEESADPARQQGDENSPNMNSSPPQGLPGAWGKLPEKEREKLLRTLGEQGFPARYRAQLEAYYRGLRAPSFSSPRPSTPVIDGAATERVEPREAVGEQR